MVWVNTEAAKDVLQALGCRSDSSKVPPGGCNIDHASNACGARTRDNPVAVLHKGWIIEMTVAIDQHIFL
jgi:hypothetical protein